MRSCPDEQELLPLAIGDSADARLRLHVQDCDECETRIHRLKCELAVLRRLAAQPADKFPQRVLSSPLAMVRPFVPERIGRYTVVGLLEHGKHFDIYRVAHPAIKEELLLKLARRTAAGYDHAPAVIDDIRHLTAADHPNLVRVYDADLHEDRPFVVMEHVKGQPLLQVIRTKRYTTLQAAALIAKAARGANAAHRLGLLHRDINPQTILIDERGEPHLTDFGLSLISAPGGRPEPVFIPGTARFVAPEQADGKSAGPATDVFALGSILRMLLFDCGVQPGIPRGLRRIIEKAMQPQPSRRYRSAGEMAQAIERWRRRAIGTRAAGLTLLILLALAMFALIWFWLRDAITNPL